MFYCILPLCPHNDIRLQGRSDVIPILRYGKKSRAVKGCFQGWQEPASNRREYSWRAEVARSIEMERCGAVPRSFWFLHPVCMATCLSPPHLSLRYKRHASREGGRARSADGANIKERLRTSSLTWRPTCPEEWVGAGDLPSHPQHCTDARAWAPGLHASGLPAGVEEETRAGKREGSFLT